MRRDDPVRWAVGHDVPVQTDYPGQMHGDRVDLVRGHHDGDPGVVEVVQEVHDVVAGLEIDAGRGLVKK